MRIVFQKRRYYQGAFRNIGDVVEVSDRFARAFIRVGAAAPAPGKPESPAKTVEPKEPKEKEFTRTRAIKKDPGTSEPPASVGEPESEDEESFEELPEDPPKPEAVEEGNLPEEKVEKPDSPKPPKEVHLESLSYAQLRQLCKELDLPVNGKKEELLQRLSERGR
jgi:hypothetical protein